LLSLRSRWPPALSAQPFPNRTIRVVVADAPGGAPDQLARLLAQKASDGVGQQVIVDNRAGAGGVLGAEMVAKAPPDGYTLLLTTTAIYAILPNLRKDLPTIRARASCRSRDRHGVERAGRQRRRAGEDPSPSSSSSRRTSRRA
jgi:tripartite-type tricarboxylate transporter receptor subunit TctC